jgi:predicted hydrocarbon binding protein
MKKTTKKTIKRKAKAGNRSVKKSMPISLEPVRLSYKELLAKNIGSSANSVSRFNLMFAQALSNMTPSIRKVTVAEGELLGSMIYSQCARKEVWPHSAEDLARFLERAGYRQVTYKPLPLRFTLTLLHSPFERLGSNMHSFETGIINGFIDASGGRYSNLFEVECSMNSGGSCTFEHRFGPQDREGIDGLSIVNLLSESIYSAVLDRKREPIAFDSIYSMMLYDSLLSKSYYDEIIRIAHYIGTRVGAFSAPLVGRSTARASSFLERTITLLSFGAVSIKKSKTIEADIAFNHINSESNFVALVGAFASGIMKGWGRNARLKKRIVGGTYRLRITE